MKKFKEILEQHREKGRFHPVKPYNVPNTAAASPRSSSDSANVKLKEDLRKWFSKTDPAGDWKRINSKGEAIGPCAREPGEPKPKCMSKAKRNALSKKERASAVRAKRKHDPNPERQGKPINVSNFGKGKISENMENLDEKNVPTSPEKWARAKAMAKSKFDVYPSAYANGWASKKYKEMGGGWKSVSEENSLLEKWSQKYKSSIDCDNPKGFSQKAHCAGKEKNEEVVHEGAVPAKEKTVMVRHKTSGKELVVTQQKAKELQKHDYHPVKEDVEQTNEAVKDKFDIGEYDQEGDMAKSDLRSIMANAKRVHDMLEDSDNLPEWVQSKITLAEDYMSTVANYMTSEMSESNDDIGLVKQKTNVTAAAKTLVPASRVAEEASWSKSGKEATHRETGKKTYEYKEYDKEGKETGRREYRDEKGKSMGEAVVPFDKPYTTAKGTVTDKSGAKHTPMSRARDIARMAMKKQVEKMKQPVKESLEESRRMEIVREAMKVAKKKKETTVPDDKYQSDPILSSQITKT
jgi:hypothetical protein